MSVNRIEIERHYAELKKQFDTWQPHFKDIQRFIEPYRGRFGDRNLTQNDGRERADERIDGTATLANRVLASGMQGGLTSPSAKWFRLALEDKDLMEFASVREWLDAVESILYAHFRKSNFYTSTVEVYREQGAFGTSCIFPEVDSKGSGVRFRVITIGDYYVAADSQGRINTLFRKDYLTATQLATSFGVEALSTETQNLLKDSPYTFVEIAHAVRPRNEFDPTKIDKFNKPFESIYWETKAPINDVAAQSFMGGVLNIGGFNNFPYMVPRWDVIGSNTYGYSPGMEALPDDKALQAMTEDLLIATNKLVDPPMNVPAEIFDALDTLPGGRNPVTGTQKIEPTYQINPSVGDGNAMRLDYRSQVNDWFYVPLFTLLTNPNATATEIAKKSEEQLIQLGPVIQRQFTEFLNPAIERTFDLLWEQDLFPEPPAELGEQDIEIEFVSVLAQAQKLVGVEKLERHVAFVGELSGIAPQALDTLDIDFIVREHGDSVGVPAKAHNSQQEVVEIREARAEQAQQAQQMEQMNMAAQTAATASNAKLDDSNVLSELVGGMDEGAAG